MKIYTEKGLSRICDYCNIEGIYVKTLNKDLCVLCLELEGLI